MQLYYEVHEGRGPFILFIHGFLSSRAQWRLNLEALSQVARPVVIELWGHGRSPAPEDPALYSPESYIEKLESLRKKLGAEKWVVCGQSFGAALAMRYALTYPENVIALVFTNSSAALADEEWLEARRLTAAKQSEEIERGGLKAIERMPFHPRHAKRFPPDLLDELLADTRLHTPIGIINTMRHTIPYLPVRNLVRHLRVPSLLVCGMRERRFLPIRTFAQHSIPGLCVVEAADAGHSVNIEAAGLFNEAVAAFVVHHCGCGSKKL